MSPEKLLQVHFRYQGAADAYGRLTHILSRSVVNAPGLVWKTWLINEGEAEAGGLYLFCDAASLKTYLLGPILSDVRAQEGVCELSVKTFDILSEIPLMALRQARTKAEASLSLSSSP